MPRPNRSPGSPSVRPPPGCETSDARITSAGNKTGRSRILHATSHFPSMLIAVVAPGKRPAAGWLRDPQRRHDPPGAGVRAQEKAVAAAGCHGLVVNRTCRPPANGVEHCETGADRAVTGTCLSRGSGPTRWGWHLRRNAETGRMSLRRVSAVATVKLHALCAGGGYPSQPVPQPRGDRRWPIGGWNQIFVADARRRLSCSPSSCRNCGRDSSCRCAR